MSLASLQAFKCHIRNFKIEANNRKIQKFEEEHKKWLEEFYRRNDDKKD